MNEIITITGLAKFTKVDRPDTTFNPDGEYVAHLTLDKKAAADLTKTLAPIMETTIAEQTAKGKKITKAAFGLPLKTEDDGTTTVKTKVKAKATNRETGQEFQNFVTVTDADGKVFDQIPMIGQGSKVQVAVEVVPYSMPAKTGITLRLKELKVLELVEVVRKETTAKTGTDARAPF